MILKVQLTEELIVASGITMCDCPIATWLHANGFPDAVVSPKNIYIAGWGESVPVMLPQRVQTWVDAYDRLGTNLPIEFDLDISDPTTY